MSDTLDGTRSLFTTIRVALAVVGVIALAAGVVLLIWPLKTAVIVTGIFASYLAIAGLVYVGLGIFSSRKGGWARAGHILLGLFFIAAGIIAFANLTATAINLAVVTAILIGVGWIIDGIVSLTLLTKDGSRGWTIIYAILSIIAGVIVLFSPLLAAVALWWMLGVTLVVLGVVQLVRAITIGRDAKNVVGPVPQDAAS